MIRSLGVATDGAKVYLYHRRVEGRQKKLLASVSEDGANFTPLAESVTLLAKTGKVQDTTKCHDFRVAQLSDGTWQMTYKAAWGRRFSLGIATSSDLKTWKTQGKIATVHEPACIVPGTTPAGERFLYTAHNGSIRTATSRRVGVWKLATHAALEPRRNSFDDGTLAVASATRGPAGITLVYFATAPTGAVSVGAALMDPKDPSNPLRRTSFPLWEQPAAWRAARLTPIGTVFFKGRHIAYFEDQDGELYFVDFAIDEGAPAPVLSSPIPSPVLERHPGNPIIEPIAGNTWESKATFNPAALFEGGKFHIVYRAIGDDDVSMLGYAESEDGVNLTLRLDTPIYVPREPFEGFAPRRPGSYVPGGAYCSGGGGWGGCEDPRLVRIGDRVYLLYVAYDGWSPPRVALSSISLEDFLAHRWNWTKPVLISKPGVVNKNACILPETVNGKYVIFHRVFPDILVDFWDDLDFDGETRFLRGDTKISPRKSYWDSRKIGVGATPLKTDKGWLLIYQGMGGIDGTSSPYKIGAMLLDLKDPSKVIARSRLPILEPVASYETEGLKGGVAYPCGAVIAHGKLFVYYGGADTVTCVASADLERFLSDLVADRMPELGRATLATKTS